MRSGLPKRAPPTGRLGYGLVPEWSPDGRHVAFERCEGLFADDEYTL